MNTKKTPQTQAPNPAPMKKTKKFDSEPASEYDQSSATLMSSLPAECEKVRTRDRHKSVYPQLAQKIRTHNRYQI